MSAIDPTNKPSIPQVKAVASAPAAQEAPAEATVERDRFMPSASGLKVRDGGWPWSPPEPEKEEPSGWEKLKFWENGPVAEAADKTKKAITVIEWMGKAGAFAVSTVGKILSLGNLVPPGKPDPKTFAEKAHYTFAQFARTAIPLGVFTGIGAAVGAIALPSLVGLIPVVGPMALKFGGSLIGFRSGAMLGALLACWGASSAVVGAGRLGSKESQLPQTIGTTLAAGSIGTVAGLALGGFGPVPALVGTLLAAAPSLFFSLKTEAK